MLIKLLMVPHEKESGPGGILSIPVTWDFSLHPSVMKEKAYPCGINLESSSELYERVFAAIQSVKPENGADLLSRLFEINF